MKRLLSLFALFLILGSIYAPFVEAKPTLDDNHIVDHASKKATLSRYSGLSRLEVEPGEVNAGWTLEVEDRGEEIEYNWILPEKPNTNKFTLKLPLTNCAYYYQPPLTSEYTSESAAKEFGEACSVTATAVTGKSGKVYVTRPADIVGSYAVYSTYSDGVYGTGKVAHIYRPLVTDASGKETWGTLSISGGVLTVTVDQKWLDAAI